MSIIIHRLQIVGLRNRVKNCEYYSSCPYITHCLVTFMYLSVFHVSMDYWFVWFITCCLTLYAVLSFYSVNLATVYFAVIVYNDATLLYYLRIFRKQIWSCFFFIIINRLPQRSAVDPVRYMSYFHFNFCLLSFSIHSLCSFFLVIRVVLVPFSTSFIFYAIYKINF